MVRAADTDRRKAALLSIDGTDTRPFHRPGCAHATTAKRICLVPLVRDLRGSVTMWRALANALKVYEYLLRHGADVDIVNATWWRSG